MTHRIGLLLLACSLVASTASAQKVEASFNFGYSASEGITTTQRPILGLQYDTLTPESGTSFGFTFGVFATEQFEIEFLWAQQDSQLLAEGLGGKLPLAELKINNYMGNFVYNWGPADARVRPFFFGGIGGTQYNFGNTLIAGSTGSLSDETRFSSNWGGGVKFYPAPKVGVKVGLRWTPTYIKSDPAGVWCDPFYGCWEMANYQYSSQFETSGGITIRF